VIDAGAQIVDVRTPAEFQGGVIAGAKNIPLDELPAAVGTLDKSKPVLLYCATGSRSVTAMQMLQSAGFERVYNLTMGIAGWAQAGLDVTTQTQTAAGGTPTPSASGLPVMYEFYTDW
jgi:rhodanese-related sulfurtransferase